MLKIYLTTTPHNTKRIYFFRLASMHEAPAQRLEYVKELLNRVSCWHGADKVEHDAKGRLNEMAWELRMDVADSVYTVVKTLLNGAQIEFEEDHDF